MCMCFNNCTTPVFSLNCKVGFYRSDGGGGSWRRITAGGCVFRGGGAREVYQRKKTIAAFRSFIGGCLIVFYEVASRFVAPRLPFD